MMFRIEIRGSGGTETLCVSGASEKEVREKFYNILDVDLYIVSVEEV